MNQLLKNSDDLKNHSSCATGNVNLNTLPKYLLRNARDFPKDITMRKKDLGIWGCYTWKECFDMVKYFALGLISLGLKPGDKR